MNEPRFQRRKEDRPQEITEAAFEAFAEDGYAATRIEDVARRAGVSKGLMYLYFRTKEELFKAVVRSVVIRRIDALIEVVDTTELSAEEFLRGPMLEFMQSIPGSRVAVVIRMLLAEGKRHPDLVDFYWENVVAKGLEAISRFVGRGIERGEFRPDARGIMPHLFFAPIMLSIIWRLLFAERDLDTDRLIASQVEILLTWLKESPK